MKVKKLLGSVTFVLLQPALSHAVPADGGIDTGGFVLLATGVLALVLGRRSKKFE